MANALSEMIKPKSDKATSKDKSSYSTEMTFKRQVIVKSIVTPKFREKASTELTEEVKLIDAQLEQLENQYQSLLRQLEDAAKNGQNVSRQLDQLYRDAQEKRNQLSTVKIQVTENLANLDKVADGETIITGNLENYVQLAIGDNIYEKLRNAEIIVEDGIVKSING